MLKLFSKTPQQGQNKMMFLAWCDINPMDGSILKMAN